MIEEIRKRRCCRKFDSRPVEDEKIQEIVEAGLLAPSGMNRQTPAIIVIKNKQILDGLLEIKRKMMNLPPDANPFYGAPVILLVIANKDGLSVLDGAATMENMLLEATHQGLGSCWVHCPNGQLENEEVRKLLSFTGLNFDEYVGIGHVALGYSLVKEYPEKIIKENRVFYK